MTECSLPNRGPLISEEITNREFEEHGLVDPGPAVEWKSPFESQGSNRREPAQPKAHRLVEAQKQRVLGVVKPRLSGGERVARVIEHHTLDAHFFENREFQLEIEDHLLVATDP